MSDNPDMASRTVLAVDVGGTHIKARTSLADDRIRFKSGPKLSAARMIERLLPLVQKQGWRFDVVSIGIPAQVRAGRVLHEPVNLGKGWVGFDYEGAFGKPTKVANDAAMQALGSYRGGRMLFLGLGTGLGSAMIVDGLVEPMELAHLPFRKGTYEDYVGLAGLERLGRKRWQKTVAEIVAYFTAALEPDDIVLGGGNAKELAELPPGARLGDNDNAFVGGFRLWADATKA